MEAQSQKRLVFSVTMNDCDLQTFTAGGPGGQHQNRSRTAVRIIHRASGARGECREERSQLANKRRAFRRMTEDPRFQLWLRIETGRAMVEDSRFEVRPEDIRIEARRAGQWVHVQESDLS